MGNPFHACATCIHFQSKKTENGLTYTCTRLKYETKPNYQFNCWTPKEHVKKLMKKRMGEKQ